MSEFIIREYDYAIRITAYLAGQKNKVKVDEIVENLYLTKPMVNKIIFQLKQCNIVLTKTGKNGGVLLNPDKRDISIYDILVCMGYKKNFNICIERPEECELNPICDITNFFVEIQKDIIEKFKSAKIKDYVFNKVELENIKETLKGSFKKLEDAG